MSAFRHCNIMAGYCSGVGRIGMSKRRWPEFWYHICLANFSNLIQKRLLKPCSRERSRERIPSSLPILSHNADKDLSLESEHQSIFSESTFFFFCIECVLFLFEATLFLSFGWQMLHFLSSRLLKLSSCYFPVRTSLVCFDIFLVLISNGLLIIKSSLSDIGDFISDLFPISPCLECSFWYLFVSFSLQIRSPARFASDNAAVKFAKNHMQASKSHSAAFQRGVICTNLNLERHCGPARWRSNRRSSLKGKMLQRCRVRYEVTIEKA